MDASAFADYIDCWNRRDFEGCGRFIAEDVSISVGSSLFSSRNAFLAFSSAVARRVSSSIAIHGLIADEGGIAVDMTITSSARDDAPPGSFGLSPSDASTSVRLFAMHEVRNGLIVGATTAPFDAPQADAPLAKERYGDRKPALMNKLDFLDYLDSVERGDAAEIGRYLHRDVRFESGAKRYADLDAFLQFYAALTRRTRHSGALRRIVFSPGAIASEMTVEFRALESAADFPLKSLRAGEALRYRMISFHELRDGKIARVRTARKIDPEFYLPDDAAPDGRR